MEMWLQYIFRWSTSGDPVSEARMDFANEILLFSIQFVALCFFTRLLVKIRKKKEKKEHCMEPDWVHKSGPEFLEFEKI